MSFLPASTLSGRNALASAVGFVLLAAAIALATAGMTALAELRHLPLPLFPAIGLAIVGLAIAGRGLWPAVALGSAAALLLHPHGYPPLLDILASLAEASAAWLAAGLIPESEDGHLLQPSALQLLAAAGALVLICIGAAVFGAMLRAGAIGGEALREIAVVTPVQALLALPLLLWPVGAQPRRGGAALLFGVVALLLLGMAEIDALDVQPGAWLAMPPLLLAALAYRRQANGAALALLVFAGAALVSFDALAGATPFATPLGLSIAAALLIDSLGVARQRAILSGQAGRDGDMTAFVADAPVAIAALDHDLRYLAVSRRYLQDLRLEGQPTIIGRRPDEVLASYAAHLDDAPIRALAGEKVSRAVARVEMADGSCEYLRSELQPWHDADGAIGGVMVFGEIATEAVTSRAAIEEAETRYRGVFEQAAVGFARADLGGRFLEVNDRFCEITGHDRAALLTKTYRDITHPLDIARGDAMLATMIAQPSVRFSEEKRYVTRDGRTVWANLSTTMVRDRDGTPLYAASAVQDITARKDAQAALAKSELRLRLRLAQSAAGAGWWEIDFERQTIIASPDMLRMHGLSPDRTGGVPLAEWRTLFDKATLDQIDASGFASLDASNHDLVYSIERPDGNQRWIHSIGRTYRTTDNSRRLIGLAIDVTAEQAAQAEVRHAQATMLRVSHLSAMGSVAATLAHELNQPLAAIVNYIEVCARILKAQGDGHPPQLHDAILQAQAQAMRAGHLVQKMRTLTPNSAGARRRQPLAEIIDNACATIAQDAAAENVVIRRHENVGDEEIHADRLQIEQVLIGIFHNAIEAMRGCDNKHIDLGVDRSGEMIVIRIADCGPAVTAEALHQLFEPFSNPRGRGIGLALPVCRTIIESHDGKLTAEPAPEGGAAFLIALPVAPPRDAVARRGLPDPLADRLPPPPASASIMENRPR